MYVLTIRLPVLKSTWCYKKHPVKFQAVAQKMASNFRRYFFCRTLYDQL